MAFHFRFCYAAFLADTYIRRWWWWWTQRTIILCSLRTTYTFFNSFSTRHMDPVIHRGRCQHSCHRRHRRMAVITGAAVEHTLSARMHFHFFRFFCLSSRMCFCTRKIHHIRAHILVCNSSGAEIVWSSSTQSVCCEFGRAIQFTVQ